MAPYVAPSDIGECLTQLNIATLPPEEVAALAKWGIRATAIVDRFLGFSFAEYPATATAKVVLSQGTPLLRLPPHVAGTITTVVQEDGTVVATTAYTEQEDGSLYLDNDYGFPLSYTHLYAGWKYGRYTVTAKWGYGPVPEDVKEVALELAVNLWREKDKGHFSDVVGVEGSGSVAVGYTKALTNRQQMILDLVKDQYAPNRPVVV